ncbi:phenylacetate--CoA ligase family protein [Cryptosporangium sp. NPDC048952]|uniref:phenylacetate--CoA ligase family protein n=1 Tax=Cryptosporangium sp. NPDC048952 TaxID=3363961 RepID=UPI003722B43C
MSRFHDPCEEWSRDRIEAEQLVALKRQLAYVGEYSAYYRNAGLGDVHSFDELPELPFTTKQDYVTAPNDFVAAPRTDLRRVHFSSGTTSSPAPVYWTGPDLDRWADLYARAAYSHGVRLGDVYQCLFGFAWFVGGLGATAGYQRLGCLCVPGGSSDSVRQLETMLRMGTTAVGGTPSFLLHLAEVAEREGFDLRGRGPRIVMTGGEPGAAVPGIRRKLEEAWGARAYDGYGSIEFQPIAWECEAQAGGHLAEDFAYAEVIDPETRRPVPDGTPGVLVLTHLDKQATPLVRWWTGDVVVRDSTPCACGRTMARLPGGVRGRADDMLVVRGVNLFPSAVEDVLRRTDGVTGEFRIVVDESLVDSATGFLTGIKLELEGDDALASVVAARIRAELTVRATVVPCAPGSLPRSTHKSARLVRRL